MQFKHKQSGKNRTFYTKDIYMAKAKPFVKWAGGKGQLLPTLMENLPVDFREQQTITYIEPFVGGGAMLFYMLNNFPNINRAIINDVNPALINCYHTIKNNHESIIKELRPIHDEYHSLDNQDSRSNLYYILRDEYNSIPVENRNTIRAAALFIFFNKTCFNGLYRENSKGLFNVPFGKYLNPTICNEKAIEAAHKTLQNVDIFCGNYSDIMQYINWDEYNFFYFDPPYRPLLGTNNFKQYTLNPFNDPEQEALKQLCVNIHEHGGHFMLSNSDSEIELGVSYFENLYDVDGFNVQHIKAPRAINAFTPGIQITTEILVKNY